MKPFKPCILNPNHRCRKCKFLKAKLEKFAYLHPDINFRVMDVNLTPQAIIKQVCVCSSYKTKPQVKSRA